MRLLESRRIMYLVGGVKGEEVQVGRDAVKDVPCSNGVRVIGNVNPQLRYDVDTTLCFNVEKTSGTCVSNCASHDI